MPLWPASLLEDPDRHLNEDPGPGRGARRAGGPIPRPYRRSQDESPRPELLEEAAVSLVREGDGAI